MNKKKYNLLAKKSFEFLNSKNSNDISVSISSLNMIKYHPEYIKKIDQVRVLIIFKILIINFLRLAKSLFNIFKKNNKIKKKKIDVLIISHLTNTNQFKNNKDFYFGNLEKILSKKKLKIKKLLINHTKLGHFNNKIQSNKIVVSKSIPFFFELIILKKRIFEFFKLIKILIFSNDKPLKKIIKRSLISLFDEETLFALRLKFQLERYLEAFDPNYMITTYEGYAWERLCFKAAKKYKRKIKCIGYQHTPIIQNNISIFWKIKSNYNPDFIWCSDKNSFKILKKKFKNVFLIGNFRNENYSTSSKDYVKKSKKNTCLVIPEGINQECLKLLNFTLQFSKLYKSINFIWRFHPITDVKKILKAVNFKYNQKNILISQGKNLHSDIKKSKFVLYRGSSTVIEAVKKGLVPLYLNVDDGINIDLLKQFNNLKNYINKFKDLILFNQNFEKNRFNSNKLKKNISLIYDLKPNEKIISKFF